MATSRRLPDWTTPNFLRGPTRCAVVGLRGNMTRMHDSWRNQLAHLATPWEWRSRASMLCLLASGVALFIASFALGFKRGEGLAGGLLVGAISALISFFLFLLPSVRSWRRWSRTNAAIDGERP